MADIQVNYPQEFQGVTLWTGSDIITVTDTTWGDLGLLRSPIQRAVTVARLRGIIDLIERLDDDG